MAAVQIPSEEPADTVDPAKVVQLPEEEVKFEDIPLREFTTSDPL